MLENLHIMAQLSAWENFIEFCCCESFKTYRTWNNSEWWRANTWFFRETPELFTLTAYSESCGAHHPLGIQDFMRGSIIDKGNWNVQPTFRGNSKEIW